MKITVIQPFLPWKREIRFKKKAFLMGKAFRAKDEIRTRDPDLGKVVLYQLSYFRIIGKHLRCFIDLKDLKQYCIINSLIL
jgi:hypothetical protein